MAIDAAQLKQILAAFPVIENPVANAVSRPSVFGQVRFEDLTEDAKCELAKFLVVDSCPRIGGFASNGDTPVFLMQIADELSQWPRDSDIAHRRLENIAFAISAIANPPFLMHPLPTLASVYLLHQLEFLFRRLSGCLTSEGQFSTPEAKAAVELRLN